MSIDDSAAVELMREIRRLDERIDSQRESLTAEIDKASCSASYAHHRIDRPLNFIVASAMLGPLAFFLFLLVLMALKCCNAVLMGPACDTPAEESQAERPQQELRKEESSEPFSQELPPTWGQEVWIVIDRPECGIPSNHWDPRCEHQCSDIVGQLCSIRLGLGSSHLKWERTDRQYCGNRRQRQRIDFLNVIHENGDQRSNSERIDHQACGECPAGKVECPPANDPVGFRSAHGSLSFIEGIVQVVAGAYDARNDRQSIRFVEVRS